MYLMGTHAPRAAPVVLLVKGSHCTTAGRLFRHPYCFFSRSFAATLDSISSSRCPYPSTPTAKQPQSTPKYEGSNMQVGITTLVFPIILSIERRKTCTVSPSSRKGG
ncbi:hypothetical protein ACJQWK_00475 [Exserohilum turcicum]